MHSALVVVAALGTAGCGLVLDTDPPDPSFELDAAARDGGEVGCLGPCDAGLDAAARDDAGRAMDAAAEDDADVEDDAGVDDDAEVVEDAGPIAIDSGVPDANGSPPRCTILGPPDGTEQPYDDDWTFLASADDSEDGSLGGASVVWRSDRAVAPLGSGLSTSAVLEPGLHTITCTVTDSDGNTSASSISVISRSPIATIDHPGEGEVRSASSDVPFSGSGRDFEDGTLADESLSWSSSRDGALGVGGSFVRRLSAGSHVITLTATDADGNSGSDALTLTIVP